MSGISDEDRASVDPALHLQLCREVQPTLNVLVLPPHQNHASLHFHDRIYLDRLEELRDATTSEAVLRP